MRQSVDRSCPATVRFLIWINQLGSCSRLPLAQHDTGFFYLPLVMLGLAQSLPPPAFAPARLIVSATLSRNAKWARPSLISPTSVAPAALLSRDSPDNVAQRYGRCAQGNYNHHTHQLVKAREPWLGPVLSCQRID